MLAILCVHGYMSIHRKPGQKPSFAASDGLRRRVIFELDPSQLPLLEAVRERHGSTRAGLIAALEAEGSVQELRERAERYLSTRMRHLSFKFSEQPPRSRAC